MMNNSGTCCMVCGCVEVLKDSGFFYCVECQTQRQELRDEIFVENEDDEVIEVVNADNEINGPEFKERGRKKCKKKGEDYTSWEIMNFILLGQVEELIKLGAPLSIKKTVFQLWTYYLFKLEAAFVSEEESGVPKLSCKYWKKDAELVYGVKKEKKKRRVQKRNLILDATLSQSQDWISVEKKRRMQNKLKKVMMKKVSESSIKNIAGSASCLDDTNCSENIEMENFDTNHDGGNTVHESNGIKLNSYAQENPDRNSPSPLFLTRSKLLSLLYIGLLYEGSNIQLSDLIRWIRERHISYFEISHFLPENCFLGDAWFMFNNKEIPSYGYTLLNSYNMAKFLDVDEWRIPEVSKIAEKYVKELNLPTRFSDLVQQVCTLLPEWHTYAVDTIPNYEGRVLAVLIVVMKLLLGLDGKTEHKTSAFACKINDWIAPKRLKKHKKRKKGKKLFVWRDWVKQTICRNAVLIKHHFPTKALVGSEVNSDSFISFWKKSHAEKDSKHDTSQTFLHDTQPALINFFNHVLDKMDDLEYLKKWDIDFPPCIFPHCMYTKKILEKNEERQGFLSPETQKILSEDFSKRDIGFLFTPGRLKKLAVQNKHILLTTERSAQKKFSEFKQTESESLTFRKYCCNIAVINLRKGTPEPEVTFIDHYKEKQNAKALNIKMLLDLALSSVSSSKKKRKNVSDVEGKVGKRKKTNEGSKRRIKGNQKKKIGKKGNGEGNFKKLKLCIPFEQYWVLHGDDVTDEYFEDCMFYKFSFAFGLLLKQCAFLSEMRKSILYKEVIFIEKLIFENLEKM